MWGFFSTDEHIREFYVSNNTDGSSAQQCAHDPKQWGPSETRVYQCPCGMYGRYVRIRYSATLKAFLQLCEVQVQAGGKEILPSFIIFNRGLHFGASNQ